MRRFMVILMIFVIGILIGLLISRSRTVPPPRAARVIEVNVVRDSAYAYHVPSGQKLLHLSRRASESVVWTFDQDSTVDSVTAVFSGTHGSPFALSRFEFSDSAAFSGPAVVPADTVVYIYDLTIYPRGQSPVTADPGIIID